MPADHTRNRGFGRNETQLHFHNAHNGAESDGAANFPGARMPAFGLSENDAADLIAFIKKRTTDVEAARAEVIAHDQGHEHEHDGAEPHAHGDGDEGRAH